MKITFLGTRGNIEVRSRKHYRHTVTIISYKGTTVAIDCGLDWRTLFYKHVKPRAILLTHAHPDHADGLKDGAVCPVYATKESWKLIDRYPIEKRHVVRRTPFKIGSLTFQPFTVRHSIRAPAVGYRITAGKVTIFCVHDVLSIVHQKQALKNIRLYIGDGATLTRPIVRFVEEVKSGHASIKKQLLWCQKEKVPRAIFTHCGSQIVKANQREIAKKLRELGDQMDVPASFAHDGMSLILHS